MLIYLTGEDDGSYSQWQTAAKRCEYGPAQVIRLVLGGCGMHCSSSFVGLCRVLGVDSRCL